MANEIFHNSLRSKSDLLEYKNPDVRFDTEEIEMIEKFWQDPGVRKCFVRRNEFQLTDSASYFFDNARRITKDDFVPTDAVGFYLFYCC